MGELETLLEAVPAPLQPLDLSMLDGFLAGVLLQPGRPQPARWLPYVTDEQGRTWSPTDPAARDRLVRLQAMAVARWRALDNAIEARLWFDPWVFDEAPVQDDDDEAQAASDAVYPWVVGFALAQEVFPELMNLDEARITEPLALIFQHLDPQELEDAQALLEEMDSIEPPQDLTDGVERLVRAVLLLADVSRPRPRVPASPARRPPMGPRHRSPGGGRG